MSTKPYTKQNLRPLLKQAVYSRRQEKVAEALQKSAGLPIGQLMRRLSVIANPRVSNPKVLKWLKPFISSKSVRTRFNGTPEEVAAAMENSYRAAGMPVSGVSGGASGSISGGVSGGVSGSGEVGNVAREIASGSAPYKIVGKNRLRLGRLAGTVAGGTALAGGAAALAGGSSTTPQQEKQLTPMELLIQHLWENPQVRNSLIAAGVGGVGTALLSDGDVGTRIMKGLLGAAVTGGATYAAPYLYDAMKNRPGDKTSDKY